MNNCVCVGGAQDGIIGFFKRVSACTGNVLHL